MNFSKSFTITLTEKEISKLEEFKKNNQHISIGKSIKKFVVEELDKKNPFTFIKSEDIEDFEID